MAIGIGDLGSATAGVGGKRESCVTRQTTHCPCCTSHPVSWVRAALLVHPVTSSLPASSSCCLSLSWLDEKRPRASGALRPGKSSSAFAGVGLNGPCGTYWASTACADAAMCRPSSRLSCPMMPCSLLDGPQRQIQIPSRIEDHHHGACCQALPGCPGSRDQRPASPSKTNPLAGCTVQHNVVYRASTHLDLISRQADQISDRPHLLAPRSGAVGWPSPAICD